MVRQESLLLAYLRQYRYRKALVAIGNGAISSAVEHLVDIQGVTGSIPVSPTILSAIIVGALHNGGRLCRSQAHQLTADSDPPSFARLFPILVGRLPGHLARGGWPPGNRFPLHFAPTRSNSWLRK